MSDTPDTYLYAIQMLKWDGDILPVALGVDVRDDATARLAFDGFRNSDSTTDYCAMRLLGRIGEYTWTALDIWKRPFPEFPPGWDLEPRPKRAAARREGPNGKNGK